MDVISNEIIVFVLNKGELMMVTVIDHIPWLVWLVSLSVLTANLGATR